MDLFSNNPIYMIPVVAFTFGLTSSAHCISMCGAFATSCSQTKDGLVQYHLGRIISYTTLGLLVGLFGFSIKGLFENPYFIQLPSILLSCVFVFWGISLLKTKALKISLPTFFQKYINKYFSKVYITKNKSIRSFGIGLLSSLLPCGMLYAVVLSLAIFQSPVIGAVGMFFFSLGTIPGLFISPKIINTIIKPIQSAKPILVSVLLICLGVTTISYRVYIAYETAKSCH